MNNVEGKVVIITGASSGIGEQTARSLVAEGAKVVSPPGARTAWRRSPPSSVKTMPPT